MGDSEASSSTATFMPTVPFFKKARGRPQSSRKRSASPDRVLTTDEAPLDAVSSGVASAVVRPTTKATLTTPTVQGTKRLREDREKDRRQSEMEYRANEALKSISEQNDFVTRSADWDLTGDDATKEGGAIKRPRLDGDGNLMPSDGMYRGKAGYAEYIRPDERTSNKMKAGPQKASSNIRSITVVDYQPDVCKDYKETGFCGYGDSCKFLHDRGDYLAGWQLDKLAVNPTTGEAVADDDSDDEEAEKILQKMADKNQARQESRRLDAFGNPKSENGDSDAESEEGIQFGGDDEGDEGDEEGALSDGE
ncbi:hypothetical protein QFC21_001943 [Naganishia friedmannii]|uniref:Uncharacterized protein n=1 Tax=Naganishia friedmannii TaxID=89922 RepID=A0ACC2VZ95_9TREE|nr:hypothetical protein QFC21_001943 [Naganishia friedmannii]